MSFEVAGLQVCYGAVTAVDGVGLTVGRGEVVALIGANGAGKSSILKGIMALTSHRVTSLVIDGRPLAAANTR
ncbi:MAG: ATP-binding cassette domain-containing protein, partial [Hyphomicrobiales bacterium]